MEQTFHDKNGVEFKTSNKKQIAFIERLVAANFDWEVYTTSTGEQCPGVQIGFRGGKESLEYEVRVVASSIPYMIAWKSEVGEDGMLYVPSQHWLDGSVSESDYMA